VRGDNGVALTMLSTDRSGAMTPYLAITWTARFEEGGAPELLRELAKTMIGPDANSPRGRSAAGLHHPRHDQQGRRLRSVDGLTASTPRPRATPRFHRASCDIMLGRLRRR
jgi:hypothetical protein